MKTLDIKILFLTFSMFIFLYPQISYSTIININATNDNVFVPFSVEANVNDTIQWTWTGGDHTTTCDGSALTSRPPGAAPWNAPLDNSNPTFRYVIRIEGVYNYKCVPHAPFMLGIIEAMPSGITQISEVVRDYKLSQNYPNPFNPETKINFSIPVSSVVSLRIYNSMGIEVERLVNERLKAGIYDVNWNAATLTSGVYYYKIQAEEFIETKKMLLIK